MSSDSRGPLYVQYITRLVYCSIFLFGVTGNAIVSYSILIRRRRQPIHKFTLNLAMSDLILLLLYLPTQFTLYEARERWILGEVMCRITYSIVPMTLTSSIGFLIVITIDRFRAVCFPLSSKLSTFQIRFIITGVWLIAIIVSVPLLAVSGTVEDPKGSGNYFCYEIRWPNTSVERSYWISLFIVQYALPLVVLITFYPIIVYHLRTGRTISEGTSARKTSMDRYRRQQAKLIRVVIVLIILYAICMLPQHLVFFWMTYGDFSIFGAYEGYIFQMANALVLLNSALNPLCYGALGKKYNQSIWMCLATLCCKVMCGPKKPVISVLEGEGFCQTLKAKCTCCCQTKSAIHSPQPKNANYFSESFYSDEKYCLHGYASSSQDRTDSRDGGSKSHDRQRYKGRRADREGGRRVRFQRASARTEVTDCQFSSFRRSVSYRRSSQRDGETFHGQEGNTSNFLTVEQAFRTEQKYIFDSKSSIRSNKNSIIRSGSTKEYQKKFERRTSQSVEGTDYSIQRNEIEISLVTDICQKRTQVEERNDVETDI